MLLAISIQRLLSNTNPTTLGDNALAGSGANQPARSEWRWLASGDDEDRPFRSVGEMGYAFRDQPFRTLSFSSTNSGCRFTPDLFSTSAAGPTPTPSPTPERITCNLHRRANPPRRGHQPKLRHFPAIAAVLAVITREEHSARKPAGGSPSPAPLTSPVANSVATRLVLSASSRTARRSSRLGKNLIASETGLGPTVPKTQHESIACAWGGGSNADLEPD